MRCSLYTVEKWCFLFVACLINYGCEHGGYNVEHAYVLLDSLQNMTDAYYSAEDVVSYAYITSDIERGYIKDNIFLDYNGNTITNVELKHKYDWLVYIPEAPCYSCITNVYNHLQESGVAERCAFILASKQDALIQELDIPKSNIVLLNGSLELPIENENVIFLFTLSSRNVVQNIYVPDKRLNNLTDAYLSAVTLKRRNVDTLKPINNN